MSTCDACGKSVKVIEKITCSKCDKNYHHLCINLNASSYKKLSKVARSSWICPICVASEPRGNNLDTPVRRSPHLPEEESDNDSVKENDLKNLIRNEIRTSLRIELREIMRELIGEEINALRIELDEVKASCEFDLSMNNELKAEMKKLQSENVRLNSVNESLNIKLNKAALRLNMLDQTMREANLEIQGLPENKKEHLTAVVSHLAKAVSYQLHDSDILKCTRVASVNKDKTRPRSVVVKLRSSRCRDEMISAVTRYNKSHVNDKVNTSLLGVAGDKRPVYISEHLCPEAKSLHAAARLKAREKGYKFVWVKYGRIYVRKDENTGSILIRDNDSLNKLI